MHPGGVKARRLLSFYEESDDARLFVHLDASLSGLCLREGGRASRLYFSGKRNDTKQKHYNYRNI